jgi:hypothetical protein
MLYRHRPETGIGHIGPVNGRVQHHGSCNGHDSADGALGMAIVVMGSSPSKANVLAEVLQV